MFLELSYGGLRNVEYLWNILQIITVFTFFTKFFETDGITSHCDVGGTSVISYEYYR